MKIRSNFQVRLEVLELRFAAARLLQVAGIPSPSILGEAVIEIAAEISFA